MENKLSLGSQCLTPFVTRSKMTNETIPVPCGKCPQCIKRRTSAWSFRLMQEEKNSIAAKFLTLTFDTDHIPITRNGYMTLDKTVVQKFIKRLRKAVDKQEKTKTPEQKAEEGLKTYPIKYYYCGEYGGITNRPHYHMILFNVVSPSLIEKAWNLGAIHYGEVSGASVGYTLKYMSKRKRIPMHRNDDRLQEFSLMSKGLGLGYIDEEMKRYHQEDIFDRNCLALEGGKKIAMPRYYKERIFSESQIMQQNSWNKQTIPEEKEKMINRYKGDYTRDKIESDLYQFRKQAAKAEKRDKL